MTETQGVKSLIRLAIVDDHKIVRDGVKAILIPHPEFQIIYEAHSGENLKQTFDGRCIDLALLDICLPDISGLDLIAFFKEKCNAKVLMLTAEMDEATVCAAVNNGADGFLNKDASANELLTAMKTILDGEPYFGKSLSSLIYRSFRKKIKELEEIHQMPTITDREKEIIFYLSEGLGFKEIGEKLYISPRTVENHKNNLLQKLELKNIIELIKYAIKHRMIDL